MNNTIDICEELAQNFVDFSYEANSQRAFPDARDGLKPGQRACLWEMFSSGYTSAKPHVKSAKIAGNVVANWWPHGDTAIYDTFTRMSQDWINNVPEVDWHGNNGTQIISAEPAAARYTEARLAPIVEEGMFAGIKKNKVPMIPNFTEDAYWPEVLPSVFPRLLVNGCQGIGVTIANTWLPVPFVEAASVLTHYMDTKEVDTSLLAPSFPSGGVIINKSEIDKIYKTGKGKVILRGLAEIKDKSIFITEMPYQVYVEPYIDSVKELIKSGSLTEIEEIYNRSDKHGIRIEIVCEKNPEQVLQKLYAKTDLQSNYSANQWALVGKTPKLLTLKDYCEIYVDHNITCIQRETDYDLKKAIKRLNIVEGLLIAFASLDEIIAAIRNNANATDLMVNFNLNKEQADAILDMKLKSLARLEEEKLKLEKETLEENIKKWTELLASETLQIELLKERLNELVTKYRDFRRTQLTDIEIPKESQKKEKEIEDIIITLDKNGVIRRLGKTQFGAFKTQTDDVLYAIGGDSKFYRIPLDKKDPDPIPNPLWWTTMNMKKSYERLLFATAKGIVKKGKLEDYTGIKRSGSATIKLKEGDSLIAVMPLSSEDVVLKTKDGYTIRFNSVGLPVSSRISQGVKGIALSDGDLVVTSVLEAPDKAKCQTRGGKGKKS